MATSARETMENVERRRLQLEESVTKLTKALEHWTTWEEEYSTLKEELQNAPSATPSEMIELGRTLGGNLVNEAEVKELLGKDLHTQRTANQVVDLLSRRIDYVQQNRSTVEKQLDAAEKQLAGVALLLDPGLENEEGLPMMDIAEELDEDENVVSGSVIQPGKAAPELMEALRKAGLHKAGHLELNDAGVGNGEPPSNIASLSTQASASEPTTSTAGNFHTATTVNESGTRSTLESVPPKKSVSFAEDTKSAPSAKKATEAEARLREDLAGLNANLNANMGNSNDNVNGPHVDESPEDAELRKQMVQYALSENSQIVAELDLEDPDAEYSDEDLDEDYDSEESEEEDEYGRSTRQVISEDYKQRMMELEKRLNARMMENVGPRPDVHPLADHVEEVRTLRVRKDDQFNEPMDTSEDLLANSDSKKKEVRFAQDLEPSGLPKPPPEGNGTSQPALKSTPTISETIVEREGSAAPPEAPSKPTRISRFKSSRAASSQPNQVLPSPPVPQPPPVPTGPAGRALANTVVEHSAQEVVPQAPDEFDPVLMNRDISNQYHRMRNKMMQQQGGFKSAEDEEEGPLMEERDGKAKKVSRFKAARLQAEGL